MPESKSSLRLILLLILLISWIVYTQNTSLQPLSSGQQPNIILIITDDLDKSLIQYMPNLRKFIVHHGTSFRNYFVNDSSCCPSRASLLRGQYAHNTRVLGNGSFNGGFQKFHEYGLEKSTVAVWLKDAGYHTFFLGKYLNGYAEDNTGYVPPGWDEWYGAASGLYRRFQLNENGRIRRYPKSYETDVYSTKVTEFIRDYPSNKPFFVYLAPHAPHSTVRGKPPIPAERHAHLFNQLRAPRVPSFNEADVRDKPKRIRRLPLMDSAQLKSVDAWYRARARSMMAVDEMILAILEALQRKGLLTDTYIFFTSDNGYEHGEHRIRRGKGTAYDEATNVPLIVRGPNVRENHIVDEFVQNIDLAPTFAELAGVRPPGFVDGRSVLPMLLKTATVPANWRKEVLIEHWNNNDTLGEPAYLAIRTEQYLYIEHSKKLEIYDLKADPYNLNSLHKKLDSKIIKELSQRLHQLTGPVDHARGHR